MVPALSGVVTKAALLVRPAVAHHKELLSMTKFKLHEAGFIVIHEEFRRVNDEMADTIAVQLDREAFESGTAAPVALPATAPTGAGAGPQRLFTYAHAMEVAAGPQGLAGHVYLFVLAHRDCHTELLRFLDWLFADEEYILLLQEIQEKRKDGKKTASGQQQQGQQRMECPLFCNATANGAKQVVQLLFPRMLVHDVPDTAATREYVQAKLKGALLPTLVELSKAKPDNPIRWLAERLLNTNTNAPPLISALNGEDPSNERGTS